MNDHWNQRLSDYLDGDMNSAERAECEAHVATCEPCSADLDALRDVLARARSLQAPALPAELWSGIQERIAAVPTRRRVLRIPRPFIFTLPQALAAGFALVMLSGGSVWWALEHLRPVSRGATAVSVPPVAMSSDSGAPSTGVTGRGQPVAGAATAATSGSTAVSFAAYDTHYDLAIAELERTLANNRTQLDTSTVRIVEQNLAIIDRAILQARRALEADPASPYLHQHLALQMKLKLDLLRLAAAYSDGQG